MITSFKSIVFDVLQENEQISIKDFDCNWSLLKFTVKNVLSQWFTFDVCFEKSQRMKLGKNEVQSWGKFNAEYFLNGESDYKIILGRVLWWKNSLMSAKLRDLFENQLKKYKI